MLKTRKIVSATSVVLFPLMILVYWLLYPAYGELDAGAILRSIDGHATATTVASAFGLAGSFLTVPATLGLMRLLADRSPLLVLVGGSLALLGWIALVGVLMGDVVAVQIVSHGGVNAASLELFRSIANSPAMLALDGLALLNVAGGMLIGLALMRSALVPTWVGAVATVALPIHLGAHIAGLLWLDALSWVALAVAYWYVARLELHPHAS
jgi:hypothetical protein